MHPTTKSIQRLVWNIKTMSPKFLLLLKIKIKLCGVNCFAFWTNLLQRKVHWQDVWLRLCIDASVSASNSHPPITILALAAMIKSWHYNYILLYPVLHIEKLVFECTMEYIALLLFRILFIWVVLGNFDLNCFLQFWLILLWVN